MNTKKYIVILDFCCRTLSVYENNYNVPEDFGHSRGNCIYDYFDKYPDFDESLTLDSEDSSNFLTIFDFINNKGIIIPITQNQLNDIDNQLNQILDEYDFDHSSEYIITNDSDIYVA